MAHAGRHHQLERHLHPSCACRSIQAPTAGLARIIRQGGLPILKVQTSGTDKLALGVKPWDGRIKYVAIFGGEAHGIGSPDSNTITTCHLMRIAERMGKIYVDEGRVEIGLWLDTLCIPPTLDTKLINVRDITKNAHACLVERGRVLHIERPNE